MGNWNTVKRIQDSYTSRQLIELEQELFVSLWMVINRQYFFAKKLSLYTMSLIIMFNVYTNMHS